jgi:DNA-binding LacI/PurR family transcriptional regulator
MAITAMHGVEKFGLRVPEDVSIVGFDNIELASYVRPALTTMGVPLYDIGVAAAETAIGLLTGMPVSKQTWLAPELIIRASTTRPPAAQP